MGAVHMWRRVGVGAVAILMALPAYAQDEPVLATLAESFRLERNPGALRSGTLGVRNPDLPLAPPPRTVVPPGVYSLSVEAAVNLGGLVFKGGSPFIHNDGGDSYANTALGTDALISLTSGIPNFYNGATNTAVGKNALRDTTSGYNNTGVGASALQTNTTGYGNTGLGAYALLFNSTGYGNTGVGASTLAFNSTGFFNTAVGFRVLYDNSTGRANTGVGTTALGNNSTGFGNVVVGSYAMSLSTTASSNTAIGTSALVVSTGQRNTALGYSAGSSNTAGSDNVFIASYGANESNTLRIGEGTGGGLFEQTRAFISGIRGITTGQANGINVLIDSNGQLGTISSSRRFKEDIRDMAEVSEGIAELRPVTFRYRRPYEDGERPTRYGLIAEEVAEIFPDLVSYDTEGRPDAVLDHLLVPMLLNELQKQQQVSSVQEETIERLEASQASLLRRLERLEDSR